MKNVLIYYYKLEPTTIRQKNKDFIFKISETSYLFKKIEEFNEELYDLYNLNDYLLQNNFPFHRIILNFENNLVTYVNGEAYILLKLIELEQFEVIKELYLLSQIVVDASKFKKINRSDWDRLWSSKVDYIEYQTSQFGKKYPIIRQSINYYIGMAENAISLIKSVKSFNSYLTIAHKRLRIKDKTGDLYNPLGLVIDSRMRDLSEYYKEKFFTSDFSFEEFQSSILYYKINSSEAVMLMARMLYPTFYFDCYQDIIFGFVEERELLKYIDKSEEYQQMLKKLYFFIRRYYNIPEIDWIIKT